MTWATQHIKDLKAGKTIRIQPKGQSMKGRIESGQWVVVKPCKAHDLKVGDVVLCTVRGADYLHLIKNIAPVGNVDAYLIGNNRGHNNGWIGISSIHGKVSE